MSSIEPIQAELQEVQAAIQAYTEKKQAILHEIEETVKAQMAAGQKKLRITLPIGIVVGVILWGVALFLNLRENTGRALDTPPCAVPIFLVLLGIVAVVAGIWLGVPKENSIRKAANEARAAELEEIKKALSPLQSRERQLKAELERQRYIQR